MIYSGAPGLETSDVCDCNLVSNTTLTSITSISGCFLSVRRGMRELFGPGPWRLSHPSSGRSAAALRRRPAGWGVSGQREHADR